MKRFIQLMSVVLLLSAVATASTEGGNPEVMVQKNNPTDVKDGACDPLMRLLGMCRSSENILDPK